MKSITRGLSALLLMCCSLSAWAGTYYHQPTPYPLKTSAGGSLPQTLDVVHIHDGWLNSYYSSLMTYQRDDKLKNGGWGDTYRSYVNFDLTGMPDSPTNVYLFLYNYSTSGVNTTPVRFCIPNSSWDTTITWSSQPTNLGCTSYISMTADSFNGFNISSWYSNWKSGTWGSYGFMLDPQYTSNNNYAQFRSSRYADYVTDPYADGKRPILAFEFTPTLSLKLPLPSGTAWKLTNEAGGYECKYTSPSPDTAHQGSNYFSLDIARPSGYSTDAPVIAPAYGKIIFAGGGNNPGDVNGYNVTIDHDGDGDPSTGYQTRYLHLKNFPAKQNGTPLTTSDYVNAGDQIGIMGTTGKKLDGSPTSTGVHLHFGVRYQNSGASSVAQMTKVVMEGLMLRSYQTECSVNGSGVPLDWIRHYQSTNTPTGY